MSLLEWLLVLLPRSISTTCEEIVVAKLDGWMDGTFVRGEGGRYLWYRKSGEGFVHGEGVDVMERN